MILLDTDHFSVFTDERDPRHPLLNSRLEAAEDAVASTIVSVEEVLRGWLAVIHRLHDVHRQLPAYQRLEQFLAIPGRLADCIVRLSGSRPVLDSAAAAHSYRHHGWRLYRC
jgi:hypothetical protein